MFKNYFISALRFLKRNKIFAGINALGLAIALAVSFIILLYVINELSYNQIHQNRKRIFRVVNHYVESNQTFSGTPYILASAMKDDFPQVEKAIRARPAGIRLKLKDEFISINPAIATDSEVFDIFTLPLVEGSSGNRLLDDLYSIVLSRELAEMFFPGQDAVGQEITASVNNGEHIFTVTGVFEDIPMNSTFRARCFVNSKWTIDPINKSFGIDNADQSWIHDFWITWVMLSDKNSAGLIDGQFMDFEIKHISEKPGKQYSLQNLTDVYLKSDHVANTGLKGNMSKIRLFSAIAFLIVLVAAINYIILSTAVSSGRAKEIGIRKTNGAGNGNIKTQMFSESLLLSLLVLPVAFSLMYFSLPYAGKLFQTQLQIIESNIVGYIAIYLILTALIGIFSGLYTSAWLSRLKVVDVLKSNAQTGKQKLILRSSLITIQLIIFCSFVAGTLIIRSQYQYALKKDPGHYNSQILLIDLGRNFMGYSAYINAIKSNPYVISAAGAMDGVPMLGWMTMMYPHFQDKEQKVKVEGMSIDYNFLETLGIEIIEGRDFSEEFGSDLTQSVILNESAVRQLGITDPVGKKIGRTIIGVVKDFNLHSIHTEIPPLTITLTNKYINQVAVRYQPDALTSILPFLEDEWKKAAPDRPFRYTTIEEAISRLYSTEKNLSTIVSIFALFTLIIAAFGLFGLTLFVAKGRTKEIGIKKVFGSSEKTIVYSFLKSNFNIVVAASILAVPVTWYFMSDWLSGFAFHTNIEWWVFAVAFGVATIVVMLTVFFQSWRASRINPVESLRYE